MFMSTNNNIPYKMFNIDEEVQYYAPTLEVVVVEVEQGFQASLENIGGEKEEIDW